MEHVIDATNQKLGRLATKVAHILQGKNSPSYEPRLPGKDRVVVKNAAKIVMTGKKVIQKVHYRHTGYVGHLKERAVKELLENRPEQLIRNAVLHMLPKNILSKARMRRLAIEK